MSCIPVPIQYSESSSCLEVKEVVKANRKASKATKCQRPIIVVAMDFHVGMYAS